MSLLTGPKMKLNRIKTKNIIAIKYYGRKKNKARLIYWIFFRYFSPGCVKFFMAYWFTWANCRGLSTVANGMWQPLS